MQNFPDLATRIYNFQHWAQNVTYERNSSPLRSARRENLILCWYPAFPAYAKPMLNIAAAVLWGAFKEQWDLPLTWIPHVLTPDHFTEGLKESAANTCPWREYANAHGGSHQSFEAWWLVKPYGDVVARLRAELEPTTKTR
jgi:hypothetical protein